MSLLNKVKERYFRIKARKFGMLVERVRIQCQDKLPSDQIRALIEILEEEAKTSKKLENIISLED